jgi:hypothetical protein
MFKKASPRKGKKGDEEVIDKYFMGSYGTFGMDTIHGRLFELEACIESIKFHTFCYFAFVLIGLILCPIAAFLAIPLKFLPGPSEDRQDKDIAMFRVFLVLATVVGMMLWAVPIFIVSFGGGLRYFHHLIVVEQQLNFLDFVDFFLSELMILLTFVFAWVYHEICIDTNKYKNSATEAWKSMHDEYGLDVQFHRNQYDRLLKILEVDAAEHHTKSVITRSDSTRLMNDEWGTMFIEDVVRVLQELPGWNGTVPDDAYVDNLLAVTSENGGPGIRTGMFSDLDSLTSEAYEKNIWPIDVWLVRDQYYPKTYLTLDIGLRVAYRNARDLVKVLATWFHARPGSLTILALLALVRAFLPRFWLWLVLHGRFWPEPIFGPAGKLVFYSTLVTFAVSIVWIGLFWFVMMEYRRNLVQSMIISALVDARSRVKFSQSYLMSCLWFGMDSDQSEEVLGKLPLIDLRISSNVASFWRLHEYAILDRSNERMGISVLLEIVIIWLLLKFLVTSATIAAYEGLPAVLIVTCYDLVIFGAMIVLALKSALDMNNMMSTNKQVVVQAKYEVTMAHGAVHKENKTSAPTDAEFEDSKRDLELSRRLLEEYLDLANEYETRDSILFGMEVTPGKIVSSVGTLALSVWSLLQGAVKSGAIEPPEVLEERMKKGAAEAGKDAEGQIQAVQAVNMTLMAVNATSKFLAAYKRTLH